MAQWLRKRTMEHDGGGADLLTTCMMWNGVRNSSQWRRVDARVASKPACQSEFASNTMLSINRGIRTTGTTTNATHANCKSKFACN